jgi:hypothetical protein
MAKRKYFAALLSSWHCFHLERCGSKRASEREEPVNTTCGEPKQIHRRAFLAVVVFRKQMKMDSLQFFS